MAHTLYRIFNLNLVITPADRQVAAAGTPQHSPSRRDGLRLRFMHTGRPQRVCSLIRPTAITTPVNHPLMRHMHDRVLHTGQTRNPSILILWPRSLCVQMFHNRPFVRYAMSPPG